MAVYLDDCQHKHGRMKMCHMIADTSEELHQMAKQLSLQRAWCQHEGTVKEHYDICQSKKDQAIKLGALEITRRELVQKLRTRKEWFE